MVSVLVLEMSMPVLDHGPQVSLFCFINGLVWHKANEAARTARDLICIFANVDATRLFFFSLVLVINTGAGPVRS